MTPLKYMRLLYDSCVPSLVQSQTAKEAQSNVRKKNQNTLSSQKQQD